jgi:ABC-2 type transport system permease protein
VNEIFKISAKEIKDALRNKLFLIILGLLLLLAIVSITLGSLQIRSAIDTYNSSIELLKSIGKTDLPSAPNINPLVTLKGFINYLGMIGALLAIVLGNQAIVKERRNGTLKLILSRPIFRDSFINGKLLGNLIILLAISLMVEIVTFISLFLIGNATLTGNEIFRLLIFFIICFLYMAVFLTLSMLFSLISINGNQSLLVTVIIWLVLAFVFPQIGDTMDLDNQLPGGFFIQMGLNKDQEHKLLNDFKLYETLRDGIEEMSPTKHYERASFALLNVKPGFEKNNAIEILQIKWIDLCGLLVPCILLSFISYTVFLKREDIY